MSDKQQPQGKQWQDILTLGNKGINTFQSPLKIGPTFLSDGENIEVEDGNISNRLGSLSVFVDSTNLPTTFITQLITAKDSHGSEYLTRYWGGNYEVWDVPTSKWIKLNGSVTFTTSTWTSRFGFANWNSGYGFAWNKGSDVLYLGNGTDQLAKWVIARCVTTQDLHNGDTTLHVDQNAQFPPLADAWHVTLSSQPLLISGTATTYTAIASATSFTIPGWSGATIPSGSVIYMPLQLVNDVSSGSPVAVKGGTMFTVVNQRLYSSGISGQETFLQFSGIIVSSGGIPQPDPELYTGTSGGINSGGLQEFADGDGPITALFNSLENVIVAKKNSLRKFYFQLNTSVNGVLPVIAPVFTGPSSGPNSNAATITVNQIAYYPTETEGLSTLTPSYTTSGTVTYQPSIISIPIQNLATEGVDWDNSEVTYINNKILWSVIETGSTIPNLVIYYDVISQAFGKERGWFVNSWAIFGEQLYFADRGTYSIKQAFSSNFDDDGESYTSYALSSELYFGEVGKTKQNDSIYIQGTINKGGNLYVDVYYNAQTGLWKTTYQISGNSEEVDFPALNLFSTNSFGVVPFIGDTGNSLGFFRFYLKNNIQLGWNTVQIKLYSQDIGTEWEVQAISFAPITTEGTNTDLDLYPGVTVTTANITGFDIESFDSDAFS